MGTINKWLHGVDGHMDVPPPLPLPSAEPNLLFIFYSINGPKYCFSFNCTVIIHGNVFLTLSLQYGFVKKLHQAIYFYLISMMYRTEIIVNIGSQFFFKRLSTRKFTYYRFIRDLLLEYVLLCLLYDTIVLSCPVVDLIRFLPYLKIRLIWLSGQMRPKQDWYAINVDLLKC